MKFAIVEKKNHHAVHGYFDSYENAKNHLEKIIPEYVAKNYFMDKTLKPNDFMIKEPTK